MIDSLVCPFLYFFIFLQWASIGFQVVDGQARACSLATNKTRNQTFMPNGQNSLMLSIFHRVTFLFFRHRFNRIPLIGWDPPETMRSNVRLFRFHDFSFQFKLAQSIFTHNSLIYTYINISIAKIRYIWEKQQELNCNNLCIWIECARINVRKPFLPFSQPIMVSIRCHFGNHKSSLQ